MEDAEIVSHKWTSDCPFCRQEAIQARMAAEEQRQAVLNADRTGVIKKTPIFQDSELVRSLQVRNRITSNQK